MSGVLQTFNNLAYSSERLEDGRVKLTIEIANERFELEKNKAYEKLAPSVQIAGFRPGQAPKNIVEAKLGPALFEETLGRLLPECTVEVIKRENLMPLDRIAYKVEKVAAGEGVKYTAIFTTFPEFSLPDISKIKVAKKEVEVSKDEVDKVVEQMFSDQQKKVAGKADVKVKADDKWAASLNFKVKNLKELKTKIKGELKRQKENLEQSRYVGEILKQIGEKSKFEVPRVLVSQEIERREKQYKARIENLGMKVEDFLRNQKTTMDEIRKGWEKEATNTIKSEIILMQVAKEHGIKVEDKDIDKEIEAIKDENLRKQYQGEQARRYISSVLLRRKVIRKILDLVK